MDNDFLLHNLIQVYETQLDRFDTYTKLALQKGGSSSLEKSLTSQVDLKPFDETLKHNLSKVTDDDIVVHLENSILKLVEICLSGPIVQLVGSSCKVMKDNIVYVESLQNVADMVCSAVYVRCQPIVKGLTEEYKQNFLEREPVDGESDHAEVEHEKDNKRVSQFMLLTLSEDKIKLVKKALKNI